MADYKDLLEESLLAHGIPFFIDHRPDVSCHPFISLIISSLQCLMTELRSDYVFNYLRCDMIDIDRDIVDRLENDVLACGLESSSWLATDFLKKIASGRVSGISDIKWQEYYKQIISALVILKKSLLDCIIDNKDTATLRGSYFKVKDITSILYDSLEGMDIARKLSVFSENDDISGNLNSSREHQQVYQSVIDIFDDLVTSIGDMSMSLDDYSDILISTLGDLRLRLVPPAMDQVLVGSIERSRQPDIKAAFIPGVNEGDFPSIIASGVFITDSQREYLQDKGFELAPSSSEKLMHERYLAYIAFTRASEYLYISHSKTDSAGKEKNPSSLISRVIRATGAKVKYLPEKSDDGDLSAICNPSQLAIELARGLSPSVKTETVDAVWHNVYSESQKLKNCKAATACISDSLSYKNTSQLNDDIAGRLYPGDIISSVSRLERFAGCPFSYYASYCLKLSERQQLKLAGVNMGNFYHDALDMLFVKMQERGMNWNDLEDGLLEELLDTVIGQLTMAGGDYYQLIDKSSRNRFLFEASSQRLLQLSFALRDAARVGRFTQTSSELSFGPEGELPSLDIVLPDGRKLILRGKIDRVDSCELEDGSIAGAVIDYKSGRMSFRFEKFYHGLMLQLISYMLVIQSQDEPNHPAAALFLPIVLSTNSSKAHPPEEILTGQQVHLEANRPHKADGIMAGGLLEDFDTTVKPAKVSQYYPFRINKDGEVYTSSNKTVVNDEQFDAILTHCRKLLSSLANDIVCGNIDISPYRIGVSNTPCGYCDYKSLCRFDFSFDSYRQLPAYDRDDVMDRIMGI